MKTRPNLFKHATSELSQDAFLCWLSEWANPYYQEVDAKAYEAGTAFLQKIYSVHHKTFPSSIQNIRITKQFEGLDILIEINNKQAILIEDKTYTKEHSNQLKRYYEAVVKKGYSEENILPIYYKTGNQGDYSAVREAGYIPFMRKHMLEVLQSSMQAGNQNTILVDYYTHLQEIEKMYNQYKTLPLEEWKGRMWEGFYEDLKENDVAGKYGYIAKKTSGFFGFWCEKQGDEECQQYWQLEQERLCFKIKVTDKSKRRKLRSCWSKKFIEQSKNTMIPLEKPRFGNGESMTVAVLEDYRVKDQEGRIDLSKTVEVLRTAEILLQDVLK